MTDYPTDYFFICEINRKIGGGELFYNAGLIRDIPVSMGGTNWKPDMPIESQIKNSFILFKKMIVTQKQIKPSH